MPIRVMASDDDTPDESVKRSDAATHLKQVALRLFAERGIDGVTLRQIAEAAGQRNHAIVGYYFGSKEALVRELIIDGARRIDERRNAWLDACEAAGGPASVREVVEGLIRTSLDDAADAGEESYNRFVVLVTMAHRRFFMEALGDRWNRGYQRALAHLRRLMPPMSDAQKNQRFLFMGSAMGAIIAARESELADRSREHPMWESDAILAHAALSLSAMLEAPGA